MYYPWGKNCYFESKDPPLLGKWERLRKIGQDVLSLEAQLKLEWIIFYHTVGRRNAKRTAAHFGISRKTFHKWLTRFDETKLLTLEEQSRCPSVKRSWQVTREEETNIVALRRHHMEYGKKKLRVLYQREYGEEISTWKIERVIKKHRLYPDPVAHYRQSEKRKQSKLKVRIHQVKDVINQVKEFGFLWHIDTIIIWWYGQRRVIFTALEERTKIAFARIYSTNTSGYAEDFLKRLMYVIEGRVNLMHQDNGSEFQGAFERVCETLGILQVYSRPRTPTDNPCLERFNGTVQQEWLAFSSVDLMTSGKQTGTSRNGW